MTAALRVLLWMIDGDKVPGGHRVQIDQTAAHLTMLGADVRVSFSADERPADYDVIEGFGLPPAVLRACRRAGVPVLLSTIYWSRDYTTGQYRTGSRRAFWTGRLRLGLALLRGSLQGRASEKCEALNEHLISKRVTYEMADLLLPNSRSEGEAIRRELGVTTPYHVVPNAVDERRFTPGPAGAARDYILYSGRFEPHKNQLGLIRALKNETRWPVILVGQSHPHHAAYHRQCRRELPPHFRILDGVPQEELVPLYRAARVHVLPSWFETTGLVSLEAALCGCNVVTTERGYARDYFGALAWYCDPASPASIREAVRAAWETPVDPVLRAHVLDRFTWMHTARATLEAFREVLAWSGRAET